MKKTYTLLLLPLFLFTSILTFARDTTCPAIVQQALAATTSACGEMGRNQVCYGNVVLSAKAQPDTPPITFSQPGDLAAVNNLKTLTLSPLDQQQQSWGVALMKLQANLPDTLPGQNVTFILFGDVQMENLVPADEALVPLKATAADTINVWRSPSIRDVIINRLLQGQSVTVDGRTEAGDWLHVPLENGDLGWVSASFMTVEGNPQTLDVMAGGSPTRMRPMEAFYFKSGLADAPCPQAPDSGILIQNPQGDYKVNLLVNGVSISLGSTVYLQAQSGGVMTVNVLEGGAKVTLKEDNYVPAGSQIKLQLDQNLNAIDLASPVQPYDPATLNAVPLTLLSVPVTAAAPIPADQLQAAQDALAATFPVLAVSPVGGGCSLNSDNATTGNFANNSQRTVSVIWIDFNCHEVLYRVLSPGQAYTQPTFLTHPWIIRDTVTGALLAGPVTPSSGPISMSVSG
ncbi:MAG: hypothetical protein ABI700_08855 [Chloroflexota bacterium]